MLYDMRQCLTAKKKICAVVAPSTVFMYIISKKTTLLNKPQCTAGYVGSKTCRSNNTHAPATLDERSTGPSTAPCKYHTQFKVSPFCYMYELYKLCVRTM